MTIGEMLEKLEQLASESYLGIDTVIVLCEEDREYIEIGEVKLDQDDNGSLLLLKLKI